MTALYLKAAAVLAISVIAFVLVSKAAWPSNVYLFKLWRAWARTLPDKWKRLRDPAYRRRMKAIETYESAFGGLYGLRARRDQLDEQRRDENGALGRWLQRQYAEADVQFEGMKFIAIELMRRMGEEEAAAIAGHLHEVTFEGKVPLADLRKFLEDERAVIERSPHLVVDHVKRLTQRFAQVAAEPPTAA
ncbi:MAG TPA: hypothetical protein VL500_00430 [Candidatus Eisenbacteria bacterium]|nr:hypothetical protein [Candidatus Eisenbacteria bacterium]